MSRLGLITFGDPYEYSLPGYTPGFETMSEIARQFVTAPTISPLFKPLLSGRDATQHVAHLADRVVVTWVTTEPRYYAHGVPPAKPSRFQLVLNAAGEITFSYVDVAFKDGIVGLFGMKDVAKGNSIVSIGNPEDSEIPGHLDLLDVTLYESNTDALIVEWTMRDAIPTPPSGTHYSYRLYFDTDEPYFDGDGDDDFWWSVAVEADGSRTRGGTRLPTSAANRIALLVEDPAVRGITAGIIPDAAQFDDGRFVRGNWNSPFTPIQITLPGAPPPTDLSRSDSGFSDRQSEVFHYRGIPDLSEIACRVIGVLGDQFDLFVFHSEFRTDYQQSASDWRSYRQNIEGIGAAGRKPSPCGEGRLKGHWKKPVWMKADSLFRDSSVRGPVERTGFERGLALFAHEFTHHWTAYASYTTGGHVESLAGDGCRCHWRWDLHAPAAFRWDQDEPGPRSLLGGRYWRENSDGTYTPLDGYLGSGHSWLDLYMMGLAGAHEVPDMFILRNPQPVNEGDRWGPHTGDKEIVTIEQIVAAEGARVPSARDAQKNFNAAFVYLLEPGQTPDPDLIRLHAEYRDKVIEHWSHITGGRSWMTTTVPGVANRSPVAIGTMPIR